MDILFFIAVIIWVFGGGLMKSSRSANSSFLSITFYCILFLVLVSLEIFVVTIKSGDTHCDYDLIVEHQLNIKKKTLEQTEDRLLNKKDK